MHGYRRSRVVALVKMSAAKAKKMMGVVRTHGNTKRVVREELVRPYEFVEGMFPSVAKVIAQTRIYKNTNTAMLTRLGLRHAGGVYIRFANSILICYTTTFPDDVVAVHELLHAASDLMGASLKALPEQEENFAYSRSVPYLLARGYNQEWIITKYMWPYYMGLCRDEIDAMPNGSKFTKQEVYDYCYDKCLALVTDAVGTPKTDEDEEDDDRFALL
jgi:hypothetical protein